MLAFAEFPNRSETVTSSGSVPRNASSAAPDQRSTCTQVQKPLAGQGSDPGQLAAATVAATPPNPTDTGCAGRSVSGEVTCSIARSSSRHGRRPLHSGSAAGSSDCSNASLNLNGGSPTVTLNLGGVVST